MTGVKNEVSLCKSQVNTHKSQIKTQINLPNPQVKFQINLDKSQVEYQVNLQSFQLQCQAFTHDSSQLATTKVSHLVSSLLSHTTNLKT